MKKALALSMALAMSAAMLAGCGGSASDSTSASGAASSADSAASGTPTVSFMIPDFTGHVLSNEHSDEVIAKYEAYTGTHVEWRTEANDTYSEKFGLTLMDKDNMPMILTATKTLDQNANAADAAKRGAFWDLTEYLQDSEAYPNLSQISPDVLKGLTVDGQIIGIPRSRAIGRNGLGYRTDWAEAVGITEAPKTVEDVYDMLYKFTYDDPDGNGANDTYGLEMCKYTARGILSRHGSAAATAGSSRTASWFPYTRPLSIRKPLTGCARSTPMVWSAPTGRLWTLPTSRLTARRASPVSLSTRWTAPSASGNTLRTTPLPM